MILTPHIGGSTQEAQENIGLEVAGKLSKYSDNGSTLSAVNFPEVSLPLHGGRRLLHIHENRPGVLTAINQIFAEQSVNIAAQYLQTNSQMGYVVIDIEADEDVAEKALQSMKAIPVPFAPVCCTDSVSVSIKPGRYPALFYQRQVLPGVTTAGSGISHFSTGKASTP
ncbi:hypothetical protein ACP3PD_17855 [Enterobacter ludwigii]